MVLKGRDRECARTESDADYGILKRYEDGDPGRKIITMHLSTAHPAGAYVVATMIPSESPTRMNVSQWSQRVSKRSGILNWKRRMGRKFRGVQ